MIPGVRVGHWSDPVGRTGCTVVRFPEGTIASGEIRGGAPATREFALLAPERTVRRLDAVVLTGGSAFGLAAADGVMEVCAADGQGFPTRVGVVPIVVAMGLFDLGEGNAAARPGPGEGRAAARAARDGPVEVGAVGAGTGATVGKWRGVEHARPGGLGVASVDDGDLVVAALAVVNASGDLLDEGQVPTLVVPRPPSDHDFGNTTLGVVVTNARLDKVGCLLVSQGAHDGLARVVHPPHTSGDGDAVVAAALGIVDAGVDAVRSMAMAAFTSAVRAAVPLS